MTSSPTYFSDSELGPRAPVLDDLPVAAWAGIAATFHRFADRNYFAAEFPEPCPDGKGVCGTSMASVRALLMSHVPALDGWPREDEQPDTVTAMDLVVFGWHRVQEPIVASHHSYFDHDHYQFDRDAGRSRWRDEVNQILNRNSVALRQEPNGRVVRAGSSAVSIRTSSALPPSGDSALDLKVSTALTKYQDPDVAVRREALEALWDAFERVKTILDPTDKKRSATSLIEFMANDPTSRSIIEDEFRALTGLGNDFQIRHHEVAKHPVEASMIDPLFARCLASVDAAIRALCVAPGP